MTAATPYHLRQIERTLPYWSRHTPSPQVSAMLNTLRADYQQANGEPYPWYETATEAQRQALRSAIAQRDNSRKSLHKTLKALKSIPDFCKPLLEQRLGIAVPVDKAVYFFQPFKRRPFLPTESEPGFAAPAEQTRYAYDPDGKPRKVSLLEAAMHNFTGDDEAGPYSLLLHSKTSTNPLTGWTPATFIQACRELDLGKRYQDHLASIHDGSQKAEIEQQHIQASRDELMVQAQIAVLRGKLSSDGLQAVNRLCVADTTIAEGQVPVRCWRLDLFQVPLHEVLVIGSTESSRIVYIPGAHDSPVAEYPSTGEAAKALTRRMQDRRLLQTIIRFAPQSLQGQLAKRLHESLFDELLPPNLPATLPKPSARVLYKATELPPAPWAYLYLTHANRLKADAATLVVPTALVDANARLEQFEHWLSAGLDLANVAALFIPGLNTVMLAVGAAQLMHSVFAGIEAWEADDKVQAAAQLESVLLNLALIAATGAGAGLLAQSRFVDSLVRIEHEGSERLWQPALDAYASDVQLPDTLEANEQGQYVHQQRHFIRLNGKLFEQVQDASGQWRISHPTDLEAYRPTVRHVAQGAWRTIGEHPLDWDRAELLRRIGPNAEALSDLELDKALRCTGFDEAQLRHAHINEDGVPPLLVDAIERLVIDQEAGNLITRIRHGLSVPTNKQYALNSLVELQGWPADHVLKVFDGPEPWGKSVTYGKASQASTVVIEVTRSDLELGRLSQTVLQQMDDQAAGTLLRGNYLPFSRAGALDAQLAEHLEARRGALFQALYQSRQPALQEAAQALHRQFSSLPNQMLNAIVSRASAAERTRMLGGRVPLRIAEEARRHQAHLRLDRAMLGMYREGLANADSERLTAALQAENPGASPMSLLEAALADRSHAGRLIGQQPVRPGYRSPLRLADGRLGYPLSGRGNWREWIRRGGRSSEERRLQEFYPALTGEQRRALLDELRQRGNVSEQLGQLQRQRQSQEQNLQEWAAAAHGVERENREAFGTVMRHASRREGGNMLILGGLALQDLPQPLATFDHIHTLVIEDLGLRSLPSGFFAAFPRLESLHVAGNPNLPGDAVFTALLGAPRLRRLLVTGSPLGELGATAHQALGRLTLLSSLSFRGTQLAITDADLQVLTRLPLQELNLSDNNITLDATMSARFDQMQHLLGLDLSYNPLTIPPRLSNLHRLRTLTLTECNLSAWPADLTALMNRDDYALRALELSNNNIHDLPELPQILDSAYTQNLLTHLDHEWGFHFNDLVPETAHPLQTSGVAVLEHSAFAAPDDAVNWLAGASAAQQALWDGLFENGANPSLREVIARVGISAQAQHNPQVLTAQVWQLLRAAGEDHALLERLNERAGDFPATCGDAGADGFSALQVEVLVHEEIQQTEIQGPRLFQFYRQLFRRDQVNALAARIYLARLEQANAISQWESAPVVTRPAVRPEFIPDPLDDFTHDQLQQGGLDDIEIRLALRQALAQRLEFPEPSQDMLYFTHAQISDATVDNVEAAVEALDDDAAARRTWIGAQPGWRRFIRQRFSQRFASLDEPWYRGMDYLQYCLDPESEAVTTLDEPVLAVLNSVLPEAMPDETGSLPRVDLDSRRYKAALDKLVDGRQAEEDALYQRLTAQQDPNDRD
ncbi:TPA: hypothetical protein U8251_001203 [Pseudomonas putida]|nr:hypothetical protein [Pseudomonas putida]